MARSIRKFVKSTRRHSRLVHAAANLAAHGLAVGALLWGVEWGWPEWSPLALRAGLGWLGALLLFQLCRRGLSLHQADRRLGLHDRLITWWGLYGSTGRSRATAGDGMTAWLERDLTTRLAELPTARRTALWRRPARRLWWLLPLLLLVWWIGPLGRHLGFESPVGRTAEQPDRAELRPTPGPGKARAGGDVDPGAAQAKPGPAPGASPPRPDPTPPPNPSGAELEPPRSIPELPSLDQFVIPRFLGEGEGRKQRMKVAVVDDGGSAPPKRTAVTRTDVLADPETARIEFRAAVERARRSRFVPPRERPFVQRYFDELSARGWPGGR